MRRWVIFGLMIFALGVCLAGFPLQTVSAEPEGIRVKPLRSYPTLDPGTTKSGSLSITNTSQKAQSISLDVELFGVTDQDYNYSFRDSEETKWIQFETTQVRLQPEQTKTITYQIAVPGDASPGGHYFSLLSIIDPPKNDAGDDGVTEIRRVASLVYLEVSGDIIKSGNLTNFSLPWITFDRTVAADIFLANGGNSHTRARVLIDGRSFWARVAGQPKGEFAVVEGLLLPGTLRELPTDIRLPARPGFYRLFAQYSPPQGGLQTRSRIIFYLPLWFIAVLAALISGIVIMIIRFVRTRRIKPSEK